MPGLNGLDLLEHIRSVAPEIPVLLMSGFFHVEVDEISNWEAVDFIIKPLESDVCPPERRGKFLSFFGIVQYWTEIDRDSV